MSTAPQSDSKQGHNKAEGQCSEVLSSDILAVGNLPPIVCSEVAPEINSSQDDGLPSIFTQTQEQALEQVRAQGSQPQAPVVVPQAEVVTPSSEDEKSPSLGSESSSDASLSSDSPNSDPGLEDLSPATDIEKLHPHVSESKHPETLLPLSQNSFSIFFHDYTPNSGAPNTVLAMKDPSADPVFPSEAKSEAKKEEVVPPAPPANPQLNQQTQVEDEPASLGVQSFSDIMKQLGVDFGAMPEPSQQIQEEGQEEHKGQEEQGEQKEHKEQKEQNKQKEQKKRQKSKRKTPEPTPKPESRSGSKPHTETKGHHDHHDGDPQSQTKPKRLRMHPLLQEAKEAEAATKTGEAAPKPNLHP